MAEASNCRMRLQNYRDIGGGILENLPNHIKAAEPQILRLHMVGTPADVIGFSEISAPSAVLGVSTAVATESISAQANDNQSAGGHLQGYTAIGIDENDKLVNVDQLSHATDGTTFVLHTETFKEVFHAFGNEWGTGDKDAAGNFDVRKIDDTVLVRILAGANESNGSRFLVPDGHVAMLFGGKLMRTAETVDEGVSIRIIYIDPIDGATGLVAADRLNNWLEFVCNGIADSGSPDVVEIPKGFMFTSGTWISFEHSSLVNLGEGYDLTVDFLIWKK